MRFSPALLGIRAHEGTPVVSDFRRRGRIDGHHGGDAPGFVGLELLDLAFALYDQTNGHRLHAAGRQSPTHTRPQQRREAVAYDAVENASGLLRIDPVLFDRARVLERLGQRGRGHLIEHDALGALGRNAEDLGQVPSDRFAFAVQVRREVDLGGFLGELFQRGDLLCRARDRFVTWLEAIVYLDAGDQFVVLARARREIADVSDAGLDPVLRS